MCMAVHVSLYSLLHGLILGDTKQSIEKTQGWNEAENDIHVHNRINYGCNYLGFYRLES